MSDSVVGRGVIELVADGTKLRAGIAEAKRSLKDLGVSAGDATKGQSASIDRYVKSLAIAGVTAGKTGRELELYKLGLRGASAAQLAAADAALRMRESHDKLVTSVTAVKTAFAALGAIAVTGLVAAAAAFDRLVKNAGDFQDMAEKVGDTAENLASLAVAAAVGGSSMEAVTAASVKLTKGLTGVDDETKDAGAAIKALGLDLTAFKALAPAAQFEAVAKALAGFQDGASKTAVAVALFGKAGAEMLPFLKELAGETGRQNILTSEQIRLADEYSDKQKRLRTEISLHAQAIAIEALPAVNEFGAALRDIAKDQEFAATATELLKTSFSGVVIVFQALTVFASDVGFTFKAVGREIAAIAAQLVALAHLDFSGFRAISDAVKEDGERARKELDRFQARVLAIGQPLDASIAAQNQRELNRSGVARPGNASKPKLNFAGALKGGADTASQEAKAQLAFDLDQIKKASEATIGALANSEKLLQANRAAQLVDDKQFFATKLALIKANSAEQEAELQKEIERLQRETFTGKTAAKDRLENDRKIADAQAKIAKIRNDATSDIEVNTIQEVAANKKLAQSYEDAKIAADAYIQSVIRRNKVELEGVGRGAQFREIQAGRNAIEDKLIAERQQIERDRRNNPLIDSKVFDDYLRVAQETYSKEIILYEDRTEALLRMQGDWVNGAREALQNYYDESRNIAKQTEQAFSNAFSSLEDALVEFTQTGKLSFKSLIDTISRDIARIQIRENITGPLSKFLKDSIGGGGGVLGFLGLGKTQSPAPVEGRSIADAITGGAASAGAEVAGASLTALSVSTTVADTALAGLAAAATAAASALATVGATSGLSSGLGILDSFATGVNWVPKTGLYQLHQGERVVPASENNGRWGGGITQHINVMPGATRESASQAAVAAGRAVRRELARGTA